MVGMSQLYGKRDFRTDGSYVTTKWFTFLWVPLVPLRSMRVKPLDTPEVEHLGASLILLALFGHLHVKLSRKYEVQSTTRPVLMQVLHIYAFMLALFLGWENLSRHTNFLSAGFLCIVLISPFVLRTIARRNAADRVSITIKVFNGKTGRPVWRESPLIWIDKEAFISPYTNLRGKAKIKVSRGATQLRIMPDFGHECRWKDGDSSEMAVSYSIAEIRRTGVVSPNFFGAARIAPTPGVLIFYELPSTGRARWNGLWFARSGSGGR